MGDDEPTRTEREAGSDMDRDLLRGGNGKRGTPMDPETNHDLLHGGSGVEQRDGDARDAVEGPVGAATLRKPSDIQREDDNADPDVVDADHDPARTMTPPKSDGQVYGG